MHQFESYVPLVNNSLSLVTGSTAAFKLLAYIASNFLVLLLSPLIIIHILFIITQDSYLIIPGIIAYKCSSFESVPLNPLAPSQLRILSATFKIRLRDPERL